MTFDVRSVSAPEHGKPPLPGVKNVIAVGAGKGGVGKTTVAVNLAVALSKIGARVGVLDGDIYGPNVPIMLGLQAQLEMDGKLIRPAEKYGLQIVSMGFLTQDEAPMIWRGPMLHSAIQQFCRDVGWKDLDYLIVDMPPGTGDVALSLSQTVPVAGAIVVTTPQQVSLADSRRAVRMYQKLNIPPLGLVENMSFYECTNCHHEADIFGHGGGETDGGAAGDSVPRTAADLSADSRRRRSRHSAGDRGARFRGDARVHDAGRNDDVAARDRGAEVGDCAQGQDSADTGEVERAGMDSDGITADGSDARRDRLLSGQSQDQALIFAGVVLFASGLQPLRRSFRRRSLSRTSRRRCCSPTTRSRASTTAANAVDVGHGDQSRARVPRRSTAGAQEARRGEDRSTTHATRSAI